MVRSLKPEACFRDNHVRSYRQHPRVGRCGPRVCRPRHSLLRRPPTSNGRSGSRWRASSCILVYVVSQWREIAGAFSKRQARYGTLSLVSVIVVLGILGGVNYVAGRQNKRWDLTSSKEFSLSDQTKKILQDLKQPLQLIVFERDERHAAVPRSARRVPVPLEAGQGRVRRSGQAAGDGAGSIRSRRSARPRSSIRGASSASPAPASRT